MHASDSGTAKAELVRPDTLPPWSDCSTPAAILSYSVPYLCDLLFPIYYTAGTSSSVVGLLAHQEYSFSCQSIQEHCKFRASVSCEASFADWGVAGFDIRITRVSSSIVTFWLGMQTPISPFSIQEPRFVFLSCFVLSTYDWCFAHAEKMTSRGGGRELAANVYRVVEKMMPWRCGWTFTSTLCTCTATVSTFSCCSFTQDPKHDSQVHVGTLAFSLTRSSRAMNLL